MRQVVSACLLLCLLSCSAHAATIVQHTIAVGTAAEDSKSLAFTTNVGAGSLLVIACTIFNFQGFLTANPGFSDTQGNTWTVRINHGTSDPDLFQERLYVGTALASSAGANTVTCNPPGTDAWMTLVVVEISGIEQGAPVDQVASCSTCGLGFDVSTGTTGTTAQADEVVLAAMTYFQNGGLTITENAPCTLLRESEPYDTSAPISVCAYTVAAVGTESATWTLSGADAYYAAGILTFRIASAAVARRGVVVPF